VRLESLHIRSAPGLPLGVPELTFGPGLTLIVGPNGSGKSTIARAVRALLWPNEVHLDARVDSRWTIHQAPYGASLIVRQAHWQPAPPAAAPRGAAGLARFGIASLLASEDPADREVAAELAQELAGGFDLAAAAEAFGTPAHFRSTTRAAKGLFAARKQLDRAKRRTDELVGLEHRARELDAAIPSSERAAAVAAAAELAVQVFDARMRLQSLEARAKTYPPGLDKLTGHEDREITELEEELASVRTSLADARVSRDEHARRIEKLTSGHTAPHEADLRAWSERAETLREVNRKIQDQHERLAAARAQLEAARARLVEAPEAPLPDASTLEGLAEAIRQDRAAAAELAAAEETRALWSSWAHAEETGDLEGALRGLRLWLRTPESTSDGAHALRYLLVAGLVAAGLGTLGLVSASWATVPAGLGFGLLLLLGLALVLVGRRAPRAATADPRQPARDMVEHALLAPTSWQAEAVEAHLAALEQRAAEQRLAERAAGHIAPLEVDLERTRAAVTRSREALAARMQAAGLRKAWIDLGAVDQTQALVQLREAERDVAATAGRLGSLEAQLTRGLQDASAWLTPLGAGPTSDAAGLTAQIRRLEERTRKLESHAQLERQADAQCGQLERQVATQEAKLEALWSRTGLESVNHAALESHLAQFAEWKVLDVEVRDATHSLGDLRARLASAPGLDALVARVTEGGSLEEVPPATLGKWAEEAREEAALLSERLDERGGIRASLEEASLGHSLGDAIAAVQETHDALAAVRESAAEDAIARALIEGAQRQHEADHTPALLVRMQEHFGRFTHQTWRIELGEARAFRAFDESSGQARDLDELSDGTRVQLLLAARLAALEFREDGTSVPLCLDEALSTTDPRRFRAIAGALFELTTNPTAPRQLLYFTADFGEAEQWREVARELGHPEPTVLDLGTLTGEPDDWGGALLARPTLPAPPPDPTGLTPEEYALALGVSAPDGFAELASWHLFTLAFDDLDALGTCLAWKLDTIGAWRATRDAGCLPDELPAAFTRRMTLRLELAELLLQLWSIGRGRPVTWDDIEASDAVTPTFEERVRTVLAAWPRDPRGFMRGATALPRFKKQRSKLEAYLIDCGALPTTDPLAEDDLVRQTLTSVPEATTILGVEDASAFLTWLVGLLGN
jgi:DNA repair exonuclease SbcCD ATPase subunit